MKSKEIPSPLPIYVTLFSIAGKLLLASYQYKQGKKINSSLLTANAVNMRNDVVISSGVLLGLIFTFIFKLPILDSITGLIISLFIIKSSVNIFIDSNVELMDGVKDVNVYNKIFKAVEQVPRCRQSPSCPIENDREFISDHTRYRSRSQNNHNAGA